MLCEHLIQMQVFPLSICFPPHAFLPSVPPPLSGSARPPCLVWKVQRACVFDFEPDLYCHAKLCGKGKRTRIHSQIYLHSWLCGLRNEYTRVAKNAHKQQTSHTARSSTNDNTAISASRKGGKTATANSIGTSIHSNPPTASKTSSIHHLCPSQIQPHSTAKRGLVFA